MPSPPAKTKTLVKQQKATAQKPINVQKIVIKKKKNGLNKNSKYVLIKFNFKDNL